MCIQVLKTPEGELTSLVLTATSNHDSELIGQARRRYVPDGSHSMMKSRTKCSTQAG